MAQEKTSVATCAAISLKLGTFGVGSMEIVKTSRIPLVVRPGAFVILRSVKAAMAMMFWIAGFRPTKKPTVGFGGCFAVNKGGSNEFYD